MTSAASTLDVATFLLQDLVHLSDTELMADPRVRSAWGVASSIDLVGCDPDRIRDADGIARFAVSLCDLIDVRRYGEPIVVRFGDEPRVCGYSLVQLIQTSLISGHFAEATNAAYVDVFSCKPYPPHLVADFCRTWFRAASTRLSLTLRG